jgi:hypothetical protein
VKHIPELAEVAAKAVHFKNGFDALAQGLIIATNGDEKLMAIIKAAKTDMYKEVNNGASN